MSDQVTQEDVLRMNLLATAAKKPVRRFLQMDGFANGGDSYSNVDGDAVFWGVTHELRQSKHAVRVQIHEDADPAEVRRLLEKILESVDDGFAHLREADARDLFERADIPSDPFAEPPF